MGMMLALLALLLASCASHGAGVVPPAGAGRGGRDSIQHDPAATVAPRRAGLDVRLASTLADGPALRRRFLAGRTVAKWTPEVLAEGPRLLQDCINGNQAGTVNVTSWASAMQDRPSFTRIAQVGGVGAWVGGWLGGWVGLPQEAGGRFVGRWLVACSDRGHQEHDQRLVGR